MSNLFSGKHSIGNSSSRTASMIEPLENRCLMSVSPAFDLAPAAVQPLVTVSAATPKKILAGGKAGLDTVTIHNYTTAPVTESVTITLAPSLDGTTAAGAYSTPSVSETLTINKKGKAAVKVPFVPPTTLVAGKYYTLATVDVDGVAETITAPGTYTLTLPPAPTTTPSLIGHYTGLITAINSQSTGFFGGGTKTTVKEATFIWETNAQTDTSLTGLFAVGEQQVVGATMTGEEVNNNTFTYTLVSADINYTITGKITDNGALIKGKFVGTLVDNIFKKLNGNYKLTLVPS